MPARTLAIGDIHGCDVALDVLLAHIQPAADDTLVVLGDVIDRGPESRQVVERLLELKSRCNLVLVMGNHEEMLLAVLDGLIPHNSWMMFGGRETLDSYGCGVAEIPTQHVEFLRSAEPFWQTDEAIFVHANLHPGVPLENQTAAWLRWEKFTGWVEPPHQSGKWVICGHTSQRSGLPAVSNGWVCIDTWVYGAGYLTCLDVQTGEVFQSQQTGTFRRGLTIDGIADARN